MFVETKVLSAMEDNYGKFLYPALVSRQGAINRVDAIAIADFIIQLKLRNPYWLKEMLELKDQMIDQAMEQVMSRLQNMQEPKFDHIPDNLREFIADQVRMQNKSNPNFSKMMQLHSLIERNSTDPERNKTLRSAILNSDWKIFIAPPDGAKFITSDNPGFAVCQDNMIYNTRFSDGFMFYLPLSPDHCLIIVMLYRTIFLRTLCRKRRSSMCIYPQIWLYQLTTMRFNV